MNHSEIIKRYLEFLQENKLEEAQNLLLENINLFSEESQIEILTSIVGSELLVQMELIKKLKEVLEEIPPDI